MKATVLLLSIGLFSTAVWADECSYDLTGTDTFYFQNNQSKIKWQIIKMNTLNLVFHHVPLYVQITERKVQHPLCILI